MLKWMKKLGGKGKSDNGSGGVRNEPVIIPRDQHNISRDNIDDAALKVLYRLHKAGYMACLVGGAVRDMLLGHRPKDFDVATDATPEEVNRLFRNCRLIGRRFRLAHIHFGRQVIEVATFRAPHGEDHDEHHDESGRILRDNVYGDIHDDVWRRDFTANALYYNIADFSIIDYVGGVQDVHDRRLRLIGDQQTRYREDPVRMLRAVRFSAKLDFSIDPQCRDAILELGSMLREIPPARLFEEIVKMFHSGHAERSFDGLVEYGLLEHLFPQSAEVIRENPFTREFVRDAMKSTDLRIIEDKPVTPAFLLAALLWGPVQTEMARLQEEGLPHAVALQKAGTRAISDAAGHVSIPKRFTTTMRDIWALQSRFRFHAGRRAWGVFQHPKFRAAYDFLCLRAQAGEDVEDDCRFWTSLQQQTEAEQKQTLSGEPKSGSAGRRGGRRRSRKKSTPPATE